MKKLTLPSLLIFLLLTINSCAVNPVTGKKQVVLMSESQELAMGKEADPQIIAQYGLYEDKSLQAFITEKGKQMAAISHRPEIDYQFRIVDSDVLNAFAIPGYVYFTRGIMANFNNEAEFAGVLGHEIGHITARHSVTQQTNATLAQLGLIGGMIISPTFAQYGQQASQGLQLLFLKFGRDAEREADQLGVQYSSEIGYDANQMAEFFNTLERESAKNGGDALPDFLSTHPNPGSRNAAVGKAAKEWKAKLNLTNPKVNRDAYLKRIDGLIYGEDPKGGYLENNVFYHPELKFRFNTPANWSYQNSPQAVQFAEKNGKAIMMMTLAPGKTLQEAANSSLQQYSLQAIDSKSTTVNGLNALIVVSNQVAQQQQGQAQSQATVRTLSYFIQYDNNIYHLIGASSVNDFNSFTNYFTSSMQSFQKLTDLKKINKKPERVRIKTVTASGTLRQGFEKYNVPQNRMEEMAILNGMKLTDQLTKGMLYKVVE